MTLDTLPYPSLLQNRDAANAVDAMLQCYNVVRNENLFHSLANQKSNPKNTMIATQAVDNIFHIALNCCGDVSTDQVQQARNSVNWDFPDFDKINADVLPVILVMLLMGKMKLNVLSQNLVNWHGFVEKYSHALPNK